MTNTRRSRTADQMTRRASARTSRRPASGASMDELKRRLSEIYDLRAAGSLLSWDESTYMPPGGAAARGRQTALLQRLAHERLVDPQLGRLIDRVEARTTDLSAADTS